MTLFDLPLEQLRSYRPERREPADFDSFWQSTIAAAESHPIAAEFREVDVRLPLMIVEDVRFAGYNGERVSGWFIRPALQRNPGACLVRFQGYGNGRWQPEDWLLWPSCGYSTLVMDTRGQGFGEGATPDPHSSRFADGSTFVTSGILDRDEYFYRRVFTDAVRAVDAAKAHPLVDPDRVIVAGMSQGGGIAQAVAGLRHDVRAALIDVPFLTHFGRAAEITDISPYGDISAYLAKSREVEDRVFLTLDSFDGVNFAARATADALYSVGLMDAVCPPSTVYAAYNHYGGDAEIVEWKYNGHEGGGVSQHRRQLQWLADRSLIPSTP